MNTPVPGTVIHVEPHYFTTLNSSANSEVLVIRTVFEGSHWVAVNPDEKKGLIVFVNHPGDALFGCQAVTITSSRERVAFATL